MEGGAVVLWWGEHFKHRLRPDLGLHMVGWYAPAVPERRGTPVSQRVKIGVLLKLRNGHVAAMMTHGVVDQPC